MSRLFTTTLRLNLDKPEGRRAWEYLQNRDKGRYRSYSDAVIAAVNGYFDREARLAADPYLETREKEDEFLRRVLDTIKEGLKEIHTHLRVRRAAFAARPRQGLSAIGRMRSGGGSIYCQREMGVLPPSIITRLSV